MGDILRDADQMDCMAVAYLAGKLQQRLLPPPTPVPAGSTITPPPAGVFVAGWIIDPFSAREYRQRQYAKQKAEAAVIMAARK